MAKIMTVSALAKALRKKKPAHEKYSQGDSTDKVWINFQVTKKLKREFRAVYDSNKKLNASEDVRRFMEFVIENKGNLDGLFTK